jgi:hypothetical protein
VVHNSFIYIDQIIGGIVGVIVASFLLTLKTIWLIKQINRYGNTGVVSGKQKVNYVIWNLKNSMMRSYLRSEHFVLCIDRNGIDLQTTHFHFQQMVLLKDRILSKHVINISLQYVILFYLIGFTDRIFFLFVL